MNFYVADYHFGHEAIIKYENRPFKNAKEMDLEMIKITNSVVKSNNDQVYIIGDFSMSDNYRYLAHIVSKLNGTKHLILGNHDELKPFTYIKIGFATVHTAIVLPDRVLVHDPSVSIINKNLLFLCGHVHSLFKVVKNVINVGVDVCDYIPLSEDKIQEIIKNNPLIQNI